MAQVSSPISVLGVGEPYSNIGFANIATGASATNSWYNAANIENPASYSFLKYTTFEAALGTDISHFKTNSGNYNYSKTGFKQFSLAMPTTKGLGVVLAYMPYSRVNFASITNTVDVTGDSVEFTNAGKGGINRGTVGLSYKFVNDSNFKLSSGFNINVLYGEVLHQQRNDYYKNTQKFGALYRSSNFYKGVNATLGIQVQYMPKPLHTIYAGTAFTLETNASNLVNQQLISFASNGASSVYKDTVNIHKDFKTNTVLPSIFTIGFAYGIKKNEVEADKYLFTINYSSTAWKTSSFANGNVPFNNSKTISIATLYNPQKTTRGFVNKLNYGFKLAAQQWYYSKKFNDYSATATVGLRLPRALSTLNVGYTVGSRQLLNNTKEIYQSINFAILLNDIWFIKPKID
jgi:hypothetical protein